MLGHEVLFVSDEANRIQANAFGVAFKSWSSAPNRLGLGNPAEGITDWKARTPIGVLSAVCREVMVGPAAAYAADTAALIGAFKPDLVVSHELLFGCMIAAEAAGLPCALISGNVWCFPTRSDVPPFGPGFLRFGAWTLPRDRITARAIRWLYGRWTPAINAVRRQAGLGALRNLLDQLDTPVSIVLGVSRAFDIGDRSPPPRFFYAGPLIRTPAWASRHAELASQTSGAQQSQAADGHARPRVLVSFGTTMQGQIPVIERCIRALAGEPIDCIVTLGPAVAGHDFPTADNVRILQSASHDDIVPSCAAVICHAGHGTMVRPIMHGVPLLCIPMGRDQHDNAARIVRSGVGLRLPATAGAARIRRAVRRLIRDPRFHANALALGGAIRDEQDDGAGAARHLIGLAVGARRASV
jgi:UDP:flavonoid glycosyltransferase YjiC (YdhE family)